MKRIEIYTKYYCPYCIRAKMLLDSLGYEYTEYKIAFDSEKSREMMARSGGRTVPQIFIDGQSVGGSDELHQLATNGELEALMNRQSDSQQFSSNANSFTETKVEQHVS